jgi:hypothetical protein
VSLYFPFLIIHSFVSNVDVQVWHPEVATLVSRPLHHFCTSSGHTYTFYFGQ